MKATGNGACLRVLIIDDYRDSADSMALLLRLWGLQVDVAYDSAGSIAAAGNQHPDVVVLDPGLPGCNGYALTRQILGICQKRPLVIALTGFGRESDHQRSVDEGFDHHLVKPVEPLDLRRILDEYAASLSKG